MAINKKSDAIQASESTEYQEAGLVLTARQSWLLLSLILIFFCTMLFFGYKDWQRQQRMRQEFEEHLRRLPTSGVDEEKIFFAVENAARS